MPVQADLYLDPVSGDLPEVSRYTTGLELIEQRIRLRLRRGVGEWFLDPAGTGLPLLEWRAQKPPDVQAIVSRVQAEIRQVPGVLGTSGWSGTHDSAARSLTLSGDVLVADNQVFAVVVGLNPAAVGNVQYLNVFFSSNRPTLGRP